MPGKAKDLRKATTLHKSLLPLAAFVIENVAYMEMPWQNIFLLLQLIPLLLVLLFLLLLLFHFPRLLYARLVYFLFPLVFVLLIRRKKKRNPSAAFCRSLTCSPSLLLSLFVCLSLSGLCVRVGVVWRVPVYFCFYSVFCFAWLSIKFYRRRRLLLCVLNSPQVRLPLPSSRLDTKLQKLIEQKNGNSLYY